MSWARLLKRVFDIDIEHCPNCGGALKIIAAIEDPPVIVKILSHLGLPTRAPPRAPARRVDLFQTIRGAENQPRKPACQRKPPELLALSSSEQLHKQPFAPLPAALRPSRPVQRWVFHQAEKELTSIPVLRYAPAIEKVV